MRRGFPVARRLHVKDIFSRGKNVCRRSQSDSGAVSNIYEMMPLKGDTLTNNIRKRLVYERYGHCMLLS